jgi:triosephosphate isomerase
VNELNAGEIPSSSVVEVAIAPPALYVESVLTLADASKFKVAVQNVHSEAKGAFTGELSAEQALDVGAKFTILGHSERRDIFGETDALIAKKVAHSLTVGLPVIFCLGEHLNEREAGTTNEIVSRQLQAVTDALVPLGKTSYSNLVLAYEPVWAIGTGRTATPTQAQEVHQFLRKRLEETVDESVANSTRIIYGGSVNAQNAADLASQPDIDGFLVGGASLKAPDFLTIIRAASVKQSK